MTEHAAFDGSSEIFKAIESLLIDPEIKRVLDLMRTYNEILATEPVGMEVMQGIIEEVDGEWNNILYTKALFSGKATFPDLKDPSRPPVTSYFEEDEVEFHGVMPLELVGNGDESPVENESKYFKLVIGFTKEFISSDANRVIASGMALVDEIESLEFPELMSVKRARRILQVTQPELIDDIDCALLNEAHDESEQALELSNLAYKPQGDDRTDAQVIAALDVYCADALKFDEHIGYDIEISGQVWMQNADDVYGSVNVVGHGVGRILRVKWTTTPETGDEIVPHLDMRIVRNNSSDVDSVLTVVAPINSVASLRSLRHMYYTGAFYRE